MSYHLIKLSSYQVRLFPAAWDHSRLKTLALGPLVISAALLALLLPACGRTTGDAAVSPERQIRAQLIGTWELDRRNSNGYGGICIVTLARDGTFSSRSTNTWKDGHKEFAYDGTWQVKTGALLLTSTRSSEPQYAPAGTTECVRILHVDATSYEGAYDAPPQTNTLTRIR